MLRHLPARRARGHGALVSAEVRATVSTENVSTEAGSGARERLLPMVFGFYPAQVLHTLVRLDIPDLLADGQAGVGQLAGRCGAHPPSLRRLLRAAVGLGLLADGGDRYELTDAGQLLRTGVPGSVRNLVLLFHGNATWRSWGRLDESVRTGEAAFPHVVGQEPFEYFAAHPAEEAVFNEAMSEATRASAAAVIATCGFEGAPKVADLGGGNGTLLATLLTAHPAARGVLFDTPSGLRDAERTLTGAGVRQRCEIVPGDLFTAVPAGCDGYLIKSVIHDWDEELATRILRRCREAMSRTSVLYLVEPVVPADPGQLAGTGSTLMSDLNMLVCTGGRERTEAEFRALLAAAGLALRSVTRCAPPTQFSVLRAVPVG